MTLPPDISPMTHDTSSLVRPYARAGEEIPEKGPQASSVTKPRRPPWLYDGPVTDKVRITGCNRCRRPVLEALVDNVIAARIDLIHLTPAQELQLLLAGGMTLRLWPDKPLSGERRLTFRTALDIRLHPGRGLPVHDCDRTWGPPDPTLLTRRRSDHLPEEPPF